MNTEYFPNSTSYPIAGPDGYAYLATGNGKRGWFKTKAEAFEVGVQVVQRNVRTGSDWTVKGGW